MENQIITSTRNSAIVQIRKLHSAKERRKQELLLLEGTNLVEAASQVNYPLKRVFYSAKWQQTHPQLWQTLSIQRVSCQQVTAAVLSSISTTVNPDGVVAIAPQKAGITPAIERTNLGLAIEKLQDPGNLGTIIRTSVAAGVDGLWLSRDSVAPDSPKVLRASAGTWFHLPLSVCPSLQQIVVQHRQQGRQIIATVPEAEQTYWELDFQRPSLILLGNEGNGLSAELIALADKKVTIPIESQVESLNVAIANALLLYEARRQKRSDLLKAN